MGQDLLNNNIFNKIEKIGFINIDSLTLDEKRKAILAGFAYSTNPVYNGMLKDCSFIDIIPKLLFYPINCNQLHTIIKISSDYKIPITFSGGKTNLSGGFANPYMLVDLEKLETLNEHYILDLEKKTILVDQNLMISDLIKLVKTESKGKFIFPIQPSSSFKLPVRVGGLISTNASGITSGKLGAIENWIENIKILSPKGEQIILDKTCKEFKKYIGSMGKYGVILNATIRLAETPENLKYLILFGNNLNEMFQGLQKIQEKQIFPLVSEFILSDLHLSGQFASLDLNNSLKWAILLKGKSEIVHFFKDELSKFTAIKKKTLNISEFQNLLEARTALAIQIRENNNFESFLQYPGFEDLLIQPKDAFNIFLEINQILNQNNFPKVQIGYGHINFRRGKGLLLHFRIPVSINKIIQNKNATSREISSIIAQLNYNFITKYNIIPKAEHNLGILDIWYNRSQINILKNSIEKKEAFHNPHLLLFEDICNNLNININNKFTSTQEIQALEELYYRYLIKS